MASSRGHPVSAVRVRLVVGLLNSMVAEEPQPTAHQVQTRVLAQGFSAREFTEAVKQWVKEGGKKNDPV